MQIKNYQEVWDIWLSSKDRLHRYVLSKFKDKELAEDITQDVLLKIHKSCCSDNEINNLNSWLFQIAHNASLDRIKKSNREVIFLNSSESEENIWSELSSFLEPLFNCLSEAHAIPLKLSDIDGIKQQEIANQLGLNLSATKSRIQRARNELKEQIKSCYHIELNKNGTPISFELKDNCSLNSNCKIKD